MSNNEKRPPGCEHCKKNCVIHLTQIINNEVKKVDMCETCPHAKQLQDPMQFGLMEKLLGIAMQQGVPSSSEKELVCDTCGYSESQFRKTGRLGCAECYDVFVTPKMEILRKIQDAEVHKGKGPKNQEKRTLRLNYTRLNKELAETIENENYERAAQIRDELKDVKEKLGKTDKKEANKIKKEKKPKSEK